MKVYNKRTLYLLFSLLLSSLNGFANPDIVVKGNGAIISDGDTSPNAEDGTEFGAQQSNVGDVTNEFWVLNEGTADLTIGTVDVQASSGTITQYDNHYTVGQPANTTIQPGDSTKFTVRYKPIAPGRHGNNVGARALIKFTTNDVDGDFDFHIHGTSVSGAPYDCTSGKVIFSHANATSLYDLDYTDLNVPFNALGSTGSLFDAIDIHPTDHFLYMIRRNGNGTRNQLWVTGYNNQDEYIGSISGLNANHLYRAGAFDDDGHLYITRDINNATLYKVDIRSLTATPITLSQPIRIYDMAYRSQDGLFYAVSDQGTIGLVSINPNTGEVKLIGNNSLSAYNGLVSSDDGRIYGQVANGRIFELNLIDGSQSAVTNDPAAYNVTLHDMASCGTFNFPSQSRAIVKGNGVLIPDGDTSPNAEDGTAFGTQQVNIGSVTRTFWILNEGTAPLTIGTLDIRGSNGSATIYDAHYTIGQPASSIIAAGDSVSFTITYAPTAVGSHGYNSGNRVFVQFTTTDLDGNFNFDIHGTCISGSAYDCTSGKVIFSHSNATRLYDVDLTKSDASFTGLGSTGQLYDGCGIHPTDKFLYMIRRNGNGTRNELWVTGYNNQDQRVGDINGLNPNLLYLAGDFDDNGYFYTKRDINDVNFYKIDVRSLTATTITLSQSIRIYDMAYRSQDGLLYARSDQGLIGLVSINPSTGEVKLIGNNSLSTYHGIAGSDNGRIYGQATTGQFFELNLTNGSQNAVTTDPAYNVSFHDLSSCGTFTFPAQPRAIVKGNNTLIPDGDTSPNGEDGTEFGTQQVNVGSVTKTFWILNEGEADLNIGTVDVQGSNGNATIYDAHYTVVQPTSTTIAAGDSTSFTVTYAPTAVGRHGDNVGVRALIKFTTNSLDGDFDFYIHGTSISGNPINCTSGKMIMANGNTTQLYSLDYTDANIPNTNLLGGNVGIRLYGIGINPQDKFVYGMRNNNLGNQLWVVGDDGNDEFVGIVNGLTSTHAYLAGDFSKADGYYYVKRDANDAILYKIDVYALTATPITLSQSIRIYDMAYNEQDGLFYAVSDAGTIGLVTINPTTGTVTLIGNNGAVTHNTTYASSTGEVYGQASTGQIFQYNTTNGNQIAYSNNPAYTTSHQDGASCGAFTASTDLEITKVDDNVTAYIGGNTVTYTVIAKNNGPFGAGKAIVSNPIPTGTSFMKWTATPYGTAYTSATGTNNGAINDMVDLAAGDSIVYTITVTIPISYSGNLVNTATITTPSNLTDSNPANNSKSDTDTNENLVAENCGNGIDDDGDGLNDCFDCECGADPVCDNFYYGLNQPTCQNIPTPGPFNMILKYAGISGVTGYSTPAIGDIDGDGIPDIVGMRHTKGNPGAHTGQIQVLNGNDGSTKFTIGPIGINQFNSGASIADIDKDGKAEIYFQASNRRLYKYDHTGTQIWQSTQQFGVNHCGSFNCNPPNWNIQSSVRPAFADFDGDGQAEIYMGNEIWNTMTGNRIVRPANTYFASKGAQNAALSQQSSAYDILPDSYCADCSGMELICGNTVYSVNIATQTMTAVSTSPSYGDGYTALADWNGDGLMDIIVTDINGGAGSAPFVYIWDPRTRQLIKTDKAGNPLVANRVFVGGGTGDGGVPAGGIASIADFDGDGVNEMAVVGINRIYIIESDLSIATSMVVKDGSAETTCTAFDFEGDGEMEIVYRDEKNLRILYYNGTSLTAKSTIPCTSGTRLESPVVADVDADGEAEIICTCGSQTRVYESDNTREWMPTRRVWNTHNYVPTWVNDDLTIPSVYQNKSNVSGQDIYLSQTPYLDCLGNLVYPAIPDVVSTISPITYDDCEDQTGSATLTICNDDEQALVFGYKISYYNGDPKSGGTLIKTDSIVRDSVTIISANCYTKEVEFPRGDYNLHVYVNDDGSDPLNAPVATIQECDAANNNIFLPVIGKPALTITNPAQSCEGTTGDLTDASITSGSSNSSNLQYYSDASATIPLATPNSVDNGTYYIVATDNNGCTDTSSVTITVSNAPATSSGNSPIVWLRADEGTNNLATQWEDQSGNNNHYTTVSTPSLNIGDSTSNYNPYIDILDGGFNAPAGAELGNEYTIITVAKKLPSDYDGRIFDGHTGNYSWGYWGNYSRSLNTNGNPAANNIAPATSITSPRKMLQSFVRDQNGTMTHSVNGKLIKTYSNTASANGIRVDINTGAFSATESSDCRIYEVLIYNSALSQSDLDIIEAYLMTKYRMGKEVNYLSSTGATTYDISDYENDIIGIGKECYFHQKQSESSDDSTKIFVASLASSNSQNTGNVTNDVSYLMMGHNGAKLRSTGNSNTEVPPAGTDGYTVHARLEREWKVINTNFGDTYSIEIELMDANSVASLDDLCLLVDDDGDFTSGCRVYSNADGITFAYGSIIIGEISSSIIPIGSTKFITLGSINPGTILPVDLVNLKGNLENDLLTLSWTTLSESNNDYFMVEISKDGLEWNTIGTSIKGAGNSSETLNYETKLKDEGYEGMYIRLVQTDFDGSINYSNVIKINNQSIESSIYVYPNPSSNTFNISVNDNNFVKYEVYTSHSVQIMESTLDEYETDFQVDLIDFANGIYFIRLYDLEGFQKVVKIIKK
ncbi:MAG: choice-of-anchor D domain-containing protein [Cytophagales bacterium]|nr:choice-of-anchor D domain-containing protein [Cytophagales bacterium]